MAQPVWITSSGSLGTVPEGIYYNVPVQAQAGAGETVFYKIIAGSLPTGTVCSTGGGITGVPSTTITVGQDVVVVGAQVTSKFTIRAYTTLNNYPNGVVSRLCDRTFTITIAGVSTPNWITPAGNIGTFYDGTLLEPGFQFEYTDNPYPGVTPVTLVSGQLPTGITISPTGLLSGYFAPNPAISVLAGFSRDGEGYDQYAFDFNTTSLTYTYEFTLKLTNGVQSQLRTFTMTVWNTAVFNASTTYITADNTGLPASISNILPPVITNPQGNLGTFRNDNFFAYQFLAQDYSGNPIEFEGFDLPPGLTLDRYTGWLYGYIPNLGVTEETYTFSIRAREPYDINPYSVSELYYYSMTFVGPIGTDITWISPSDLGYIDNGGTSTFTVAAVDATGIALQYRLKSGSDSKLPQGLTLLPSGNIVGRVSFIVFNLDNNTTTFDSNKTTFDLTYTFIVNAYSANGIVNVFKEFTIHVVDAYPIPYNNLYIQCMPPLDDRASIQNLLQNNDIFPQASLYRPDDPNFGIATSVIYNHAYGLSATTVDNYVKALQLNHYWKNLVLGEIKTARALDDLGNVLYEVVYSEVIDDQVNNDGQSTGKQLVLPYPVNVNTPFQIDEVYPNALTDMRNQVIDTVGQISNVLPRWMYSKQVDGRVLGFTPAWVIAYTVPNASGQIAYNISQYYGVDKLNLIDFRADRYELDRSMTMDWDPATQQWIPNPAEETTFDVSDHYQLSTIDIIPPVGFGHYIGEVLTMPGTYFGGITPDNDLTLTVSQTTDGGAIQQAFCSGFAPYNSAGSGQVISIGNISGDGNIITVSFASQTFTPFIPGSTVLIEGVKPASYNGTYTVIYGTAGTIQVYGTATDTWISGGIVSSAKLWPAVPAGADGPLATSTSSKIQSSSQSSIFGTINGTVLTISGGIAAAGQLLTGPGVAPNTYIVAPIFGVMSLNTTFTSLSGSSVLTRGTYPSVFQSSTTGNGIGGIFNVRTTGLPSPNYLASNTIITLVSGGEGYAVGDRITIPGSRLGGTSPANDLTFTLSGSISNSSSWIVSVEQSIPAATTITATTYSLVVGGTTTGSFAPGLYITSVAPTLPLHSTSIVAPGTQIITQLTSTATVATTTATGTINTLILNVSNAANIAVGQLVSGYNGAPGISTSTVVVSISGTQITLSQALTANASGTYIFSGVGAAGTYAVNIAHIASSTNIIATDAIFNVESVPGVATIFDGGSVNFVSPADRITNTNNFDAYLLYPKDNIIDNLPQSVAWLNNSGAPIEWVNDEIPPNPEAFWNT